MALAKYGGGIVQLSGSIGGSTFARNRFGNYVRARTTPVNPNTAQQVVVRSILSELAVRWSSTLTPAQRAAWENYADNIVMQNRLSDNITLTGYNHYIRSNSLIRRDALPYVDDGPILIELPAKDPQFSIIAEAANARITVTFDTAQSWVSEDNAQMFIFAGSPQKVTHNFFAGPWKYNGREAGDNASPPTSPFMLTSEYTLIQGQKIWCYARILRADGRVTTPFQVDTIIAA